MNTPLSVPMLVSDPGDLVALCGDWHGNLLHAERCLEAAAEHGVRIVIHVGDFMFRYDGVYNRNIKKLENICARLDITLLFIDGNHDDHEFLRSADTDTGVSALTTHILHIRRGTVWTWRDHTWLGMGGAGSIDARARTAGYDWWTDENVTSGQIYRALDNLAGSEPDVIISHERPSWSPRPLPHVRFPDSVVEWISVTTDLLGHLPLPKVWFYGHYHIRKTMMDRGVRFEVLDRDHEPLSESMVLMNTDTLECVPL